MNGADSYRLRRNNAARRTTAGIAFLETRLLMEYSKPMLRCKEIQTF